MVTSLYNTEMGAGSLLVTESRKVAAMILNGASEADWQRFINVDNELQKRSLSSAKRQTRLLRNRLEPVPRELLQIVVSGSNEAAVQALLAAAIKHSRLLGDYMDKVILIKGTLPFIAQARKTGRLGYRKVIRQKKCKC